MQTPKTIAYVDLHANDPVPPSALFVLRRFDHNSFRPGSTEVPHRHNYHEIFIVDSGYGKHAIDGQVAELVPYSVSFITRGQVHIVEQLIDLNGWLIRFSDDFLPAGLISQSWNYHATLFNQLGHKHGLQVGSDDFESLRRVLDLIEAEWTQSDAFQKDDVLRHLLAIIIIRLERIYQQSLSANQHEREEYKLYQQFMTLLEDHFHAHHDVQHYADALGITPVKLSRILGRIVGRSTKQLIDERIVLEAKRHLHYTDLTITEIALALGYTDQFHFSKTFKRLAGMAPQAFRDQRQKMT